MPSDPLGVALLVSLAVLPLLLGIGLLLLGRIWGEARQMRSTQLRLALASELGLPPRELAMLSSDGLLKLRDQVVFDELTGVLRRMAGVASIEREVARARRSAEPLSVAFVDVDGLKQVNDTRGHNAGDQLLRQVAALLVNGLRGQDLVFRYGGDEFVCVLPNVSSAAAETKLRDLRKTAADRGLAFSVGVAQLEPGDDLVSLLGRADQRLYDDRSRRREDLQGTATLLPIRIDTTRGFAPSPSGDQDGWTDS